MTRVDENEQAVDLVLVDEVDACQGQHLDIVGGDFGDVVVVHVGALLGVELGAVAAAEFVAVVAVIVVAGGEQDAHLRLDVGDGKGDLGEGAGLVEEVHGEAVGQEFLCDDLGEVAAADAAVVADDDLVEALVAAEFSHAGAGEQEDDVVDGVGALEDGGVQSLVFHLNDAVAVTCHEAADAAGAEAHFLAEGIDDFLPFSGVHGGEDALADVGGNAEEVLVGEPLLQEAHGVFLGHVIALAVYFFFLEGGIEVAVNSPGDFVEVNFLHDQMM